MADADDLQNNRLWAAMDSVDQAALRPRMALRHLPQGDVLTQTGETVSTVYLPTTADLANIIRFSDGRSAMATNVGREGVSGLAAFLANEPCGWDDVPEEMVQYYDEAEEDGACLVFVHDTE